MSLDSKVVWSEGMFLNPQHFQQQERYLERYINSKCAAYGNYGWGLYGFKLDEQLLKLGKISITQASGVFPDGTPFNFPDIDEPPAVFEVSDNLHGSILYLGVPVRRPGAVDILPANNVNGGTRYYLSKQKVRDIAGDDGENLDVEVGKLRVKLLLDTDDLSGYVVIGLLRIEESRDDKTILLDDQYIPTFLGCKQSPRLQSFLIELVGLLRHRAESIAGRLADVERGGVSEVADYMLLQLINRLEPLATHLSSIDGLHPLDLYSESVQILGELCTFFAKNKRPPVIPIYQHDNLEETFTPIMNWIREGLSMVYEQTAIALKLVEKRYGIHVAEMTDSSLVQTAQFILSARGDVSTEFMRTHLPAKIKIGSVERIRQLVNSAMPGVQINPLPVAPRQIPFRAGYTYFELDKHSEFWKELQHSGGFAIHVGGDFPGLEMEFWAIRQ
ncbi:MAG: type VI secretion system baseplate subunit TssK [Pseudomonadota bacterium]